MMKLRFVFFLILSGSVLFVYKLVAHINVAKEKFRGVRSGYTGARSPRMFMIQAGLRSQFALGFMDPPLPPVSTISVPTVPTALDWTVNQTALNMHRADIEQFVDAERNISLVRSEVRVGQVMHFDYSEQKYVFPISASLYSLIPEESPFQNKHYNACAVVGSGGILSNSYCGNEIDRADFVFRCNFAPIDKYKSHVGSKTNFTTFNPSVLEKYFNNLQTIYDRARFLGELRRLKGAVLWIPAFSFHGSNMVTRTLTDFFLEHERQFNPKLNLAWPGNVMKHFSDFWKTKGLSPKRLSTGMIVYTLATMFCEEVRLYGFWPYSVAPDHTPLSYHYYDKKGTTFTMKWKQAHQLPEEFNLLQQLHKHGVLKLTVTPCSS
ncbi:Sia-alpha-2,3-Gal-beta-1,4-GlcNAc-R:alpha 2,8-sialyltransferase [Branchiostoma belcheri]|nr:Sia-alpha-2,3-Gal-beta-1,4-GlcNAc-R:alpha 2,8-sialyltransferase [Branchiostoma belcheri]